MAKPLDQLLQKDMDRKEFLLTMGFGMASIMGFSRIIHLLTGKGQGLSTGNHPYRTSGYGSTDYGNKAGVKKTA